LAYAALQTLPRDVEEAARIDGAKVWQRFFHIKLPLLAPSLAAIFLLKLILSFKIFDLIYVLTAGGPAVDTNLATFKIRRTLFQDFNLGLASAETIIFSLFVGLITLPVTWLNKKMQFAADL
jgi:multiple sugar transport system permease protein